MTPATREGERVIGLVVNPIAGLGGAVGLKGTDGADTLALARAAGAVPHAPERARLALATLASATPVRVLCAPGVLGEESCAGLDVEVEVLGELGRPGGSGADTERAVSLMRGQVDLLVFAGGDGTARDVWRAAGEDLVVVGVPAGVKMHSAVFATSARAAGELAGAYLNGHADVIDAEVMDLDEDDYRLGRVSARLYGCLRVPSDHRHLAGMKTSSPPGEEVEAAEIGRAVAAEMDDETLYVLGPGTTVRAVATALGVEKTLIGVDVVRAGRLVGRDVAENDLLAMTREAPARIVVTIIGGQGYLFGRGNQQISARVIAQVGVDHLTVVATERKLAALRGRPLLVDTGDDAVDRSLAGSVQVRTGPHRRAVYRVSPPA